MSAVHYKIAIHHTLSALFLLLIVLLLALPAQAQSNDARLKRIENEIETLSRAVFRGETPPPGSIAVGDDVSGTSAANTELRLQQIELSLRELTGKVEERNYELQQFQSQTQAAIGALEAKVAELEMRFGGGAVPGPATAAPSYTFNSGGVSAGLGPDTAETTAPSSYEDDMTGEPTMGQLGTITTPQTPPEETTYPTAAPLPVDDPVGLYEQAFSYLRDRNYDQAEVVFQDFLTRYPEHDLAANAQYWLGESYYVRNDFEKAARVFAEAYQKYPKGPKGPDNLLKLGMALTGLGKKEDACLTYAQLQKEYPNGAIPVMMRAEQEMEKLACQQF